MNDLSLAVVIPPTLRKLVSAITVAAASPLGGSFAMMF